MQTNTLKAKTKRITSARVGRGGKRGKTSGRGTKGQKARSGRKMRPEMRDLIKKLPKLRGHGKNRARTVRADRVRFVAVNIASLEAVFSSGDVVNADTLLKAGLIKTASGRIQRAKILGSGELTKKLDISGIPVSAGAKTAIEKAGGSVLA
jgi:large subunit ribosomal protein L15